jgi:hypothetical protein
MQPQAEADGPAVIEKFEQWVRLARRIPVTLTPLPPRSAMETTSVENGASGGRFSPSSERAAPVVKKQDWVEGKIDAFVLRSWEPGTSRHRPRRTAHAHNPPAPTSTPPASVPPTSSGSLREGFKSRGVWRDPWKTAWRRRNTASAGAATGSMSHAYGRGQPTSEANQPAVSFAWRYRDWVNPGDHQDCRTIASSSSSSPPI